MKFKTIVIMLKTRVFNLVSSAFWKVRFLLKSILLEIYNLNSLFTFHMHVLLNTIYIYICVCVCVCVIHIN